MFKAHNHTSDLEVHVFLLKLLEPVVSDYRNCLHQGFSASGNFSPMGVGRNRRFQLQQEHMHPLSQTFLETGGGRMAF